MRPAFALIPIAALVVAACIGAETRGSAADDSFTLPSDGKGAGGSLPPAIPGTFRGVLSFDAIEGGCAFLEAADGTRFEVVYPEGWALDRAAAHLRGPDGQDVAAGATVEVEGTIARDRSSICQVGPIVVATRVTAPAP